MSILVRSIAADWAQLSDVFHDQPVAVRRLLRHAFYAGNACALSQVAGTDPAYVCGMVVIDAGMVEAMQEELERFVKEVPAYGAARHG